MCMLRGADPLFCLGLASLTLPVSVLCDRTAGRSSTTISVTELSFFGESQHPLRVKLIEAKASLVSLKRRLRFSEPREWRAPCGRG